MADSQWIHVPLVPRLVKNVARVNIGQNGLAQMLDVYDDREKGTISTRRGHVEGDSPPTSHPFGIAVAKKRMWNDEDWTAVIARNAGGQSQLFINKGNGYEGTFSPGEINSVPLPGSGIVSLDATESAIRTFGENSGWYGRLEVEPKNGVIRRWNSDTGPVVDEELGSNNELRIEADWFSFENIVAHPDQGDYGVGNSITYWLSVVYSGGQESKIVTGVMWGALINADAGHEKWYVTLKIRVAIGSLPKRVVAIRLYRDLFVSDTGSHREPELVATIPIYRLAGEDAEWTLPSDVSAVSETIRDYNNCTYTYEQMTGFYYDSTKSINNRTAKSISLKRRIGRVGSDRAFYAGVTDENEVEHWDRLYYSHYQQGFHCPDIVLPENFTPMGFRILDIVDSKAYRIVIGDVGFAVIVVAGGVGQWQVHTPLIPVGCIARNTICATARGPAFLGSGGLYIIEGPHATGPFMREIWPDIEDSDDLENAIGAYSQMLRSYYLAVGENLYAFSIETGACRQLTFPFTVTAMNSTPDGGVIAVCGRLTYSVESLLDAVPEATGLTPAIETGYLQFLPDPSAYQIVKAVQLSYRSECDLQFSITPHPRGEAAVFTVPAAPDGSVMYRTLPAGDLDMAPRHSFKVEAIGSSGFPRMHIEALHAEIVPSERRL